MTRMGRGRALVAMARPAQIALIALVFVNGLLLGAYRGAVIAGVGGIVVASALLLGASVAVHLANEAADARTDRLTARTPFSGGSGALEASGLSPSVPLATSLGVALAAAVLAVLAVRSGSLPPTAAALLLAGLAGGLLYSLPPVSAMRRGWGEALNALLGALLLPLYGVAVVAGTLAWLDVVAFLPFTLVALASVMATAWPDRGADAATGKGTMQVRLPVVTLRRIHVLALAGFVLASLLSAAIGAMPLALAGLAVTPVLVLGSWGYTRRESPLPNVAAMVGLALVTAAGLLLTLAARECYRSARAGLRLPARDAHGPRRGSHGRTGAGGHRTRLAVAGIGR
jgi:1,4-dihydroxy-2-naphthoate octaprenyltransferase